MSCSSSSKAEKTEKTNITPTITISSKGISVIYGAPSECTECLDIVVDSGSIHIPDTLQNKLDQIKDIYCSDQVFQVDVTGYFLFDHKLSSREINFLFQHYFKIYGELIDIEHNIRPIFKADSVFVLKDGNYITFENAFTPNPSIIIHNKNDYDTSFLYELSTINYDSVSLIGNEMIVQRNHWIDTIYFPDIPPIGQYKVFTARKDNLAVALSIERINYTTINYKVEMVEFGKANYKTKGKAHLNSRFFLGSETAKNTNTGHLLYLAKFSSNDEKEGCYTTIGIGYEDESPHILYAVLDKNCNDSLPNISNENFKTLTEK